MGGKRKGEKNAARIIMIDKLGDSVISTTVMLQADLTALLAFSQPSKRSAGVARYNSHGSLSV